MGRSRDLEVPIKELRAQGKTYKEIAEALNTSKSNISYHIGKGGTEKLRVKNATRGKRRAINDHVKELKTITPCVDCGKFYPPHVTQYDHLPQFVKSFGISRFHSYTLNLDVVLAEIAKCELVCANCHAERTDVRRIERKKRKEIYHDILDNDDHDYVEEDE